MIVGERFLSGVDWADVCSIPGRVGFLLHCLRVAVCTVRLVVLSGYGLKFLPVARVLFIQILSPLFRQLAL